MFSKWLWKKQVQLHAYRYFVKALIGQQRVRACGTMLAAGSLFLPASDPISTDRTSGHNICLDFTASSAQTFSLKLLIKKSPQPCPSSQSLSQPAPAWFPFFPSFPSWSVHSFLSPINLSCRMWPTRGVSPTVSPLFLISTQIFVPPVKWCFLHLSCFPPCPLSLPSFAGSSLLCLLMTSHSWVQLHHCLPVFAFASEKSPAAWKQC